MKLFECQFCGQALFFENTHCERCGHRLGYLPDATGMTALEPEASLWKPLAEPERRVRFCSNSQHDVCNWLVDQHSPEAFCLACRHNRTIPNLSEARNLQRWRHIEAAKRRLFYGLLRLRLPLLARQESPEGLAFDFLADPHEGIQDAGPTVLTGHDNGLITLNLAEADDVERERRRNQLGEPYRTLLGHFRHEVGHYFWDQLVRDNPARYREVFGDERADYGKALKDYYARGPRPDWRNAFVSPYASSHPWEDFAETWAHYLHMVDTLETAYAFGMHVEPLLGAAGQLATAIDFDAYEVEAFEPLIQAWLPLTFAVN
ncbi:MAG: hypothetical protein QOD74_489, partial [Variibacter sp.]|nr:hypothetical protein [Variibacter sp.]